jgi:hypothetical protein
MNTKAEGTRVDFEGIEYGPTSRLREYTVAVLEDSTNIYRGFGMTLARVIAEETAQNARRYEIWMEAGRASEYAAGEPDRVVWRGFRALCVLRPMADGSLDVIDLPLSGETGCVL